MVFSKMKLRLEEWLYKTKDPWICAPHAVLEDKGHFKDNPQCMPLYNEDVLLDTNENANQLVNEHFEF